MDKHDELYKAGRCYTATNAVILFDRIEISAGKVGVGGWWRRRVW